MGDLFGLSVLVLIGVYVVWALYFAKDEDGQDGPQDGPPEAS